MATTVDTLLVRIEADMADLKRDVARATSTVETHTQRMAGAFRMVAGAVAAIGGGALFGSFIRDTINTGAQVEGLRVQLNALLGSAEEGARAFDVMSQFASRVPFSLEQIQQASGSLAAASDDAGQLGELLQITGNIASQFGIPFEEAASNVQSAMSAGIASADIFGDRGVSAFMGFERGVSYSASETARRLIEHFGTGGTSDGAMDQFARTTGGALSMFGDAMFGMRRTIAESGLNEGFVDLVNVITDMLKGSGDLAATIGSTLGEAFSSLAGILRRVYNASSEISAAFSAVIELGRTLAAAILSAFGLTIQDAMNAVQIALNAIVENMNVLIPITVAYVSIRLARTMVEGARAAIQLAMGLRGVGFAQNALNLVVKRGLGFWIALLAIFGQVTGATDGLVERLGGIAQQIYEALPEGIRGSIDNISEGFGQATEAINEARDALRQPLRMEINAPGETTEEVINRTTQAIQAALAAQGGSAAGAQREFDRLKTTIEGMQPEYVQLQAQIDAITAALPRMNGQLREQAEVALTLLRQQLRDLNPMYATLKDATIQFSQSIASSFADALVEGKDAMEGLKNAFKGFVKQMIAKALELYVFNHIINSVFNLTGSSALPTGRLFKLATGGALQPGVPTLVGERGPELIVPQSAGANVLNSNNTRRAMSNGGSGVTVVQHLNVSAGVSQTVRAEMMSLLPVFKENTMAAVVDARRRGGSFGQAFG